MKKLIFTLFGGLLMLSVAYSQPIKGRVTDSLSHTPLAGVNLRFDGTTLGTTTDEDGFFQLQTPDFPTVLTISYLGYQSQKITLTNPPRNPLFISLQEVAHNLSEVVISAKTKVDTVFHPPYSVVDYEFYDPYILLLVYQNVAKRHRLLLIDEAGKVLSEDNLEGISPVQFYKGCLGGVHLLSTTTAQQVFVIAQKVSFSEPSDLETFQKVAFPCRLATQNYLYFIDFSYGGQLAEYWRVSKKKPNLGKQKVTAIANLKKIEMFKDEARFQAMASGGRVSSGEQLSNPNFVERVIYKPVETALFEKKDTLLIFNYTDGEIQFLNDNLVILRTVSFHFHQNKKWKKILLYDPESGDFVTLFDTKWSYSVWKLNPHTGNLQFLTELDRDFIRNIKIHKRHLYFLHNHFRNGDVIQKLQKIRF